MNNYFLSIKDRAQKNKKNKKLFVDFYRIRRKLAFDIPFASLGKGDFLKIRNFQSSYPYEIWVLWALEDRVFSFLDFEDCIDFLERDIDALISLPDYRYSSRLDLKFSHIVRILNAVLTSCSYISKDFRSRLIVGLERAVSIGLPVYEVEYQFIESPENILRQSNRDRYLHNIAVIGTVVLALAATAVKHPSSSDLNSKVNILFKAVLDSRQDGHTEGVSYDGYVLDFFLDWLKEQPSIVQSDFLNHPELYRICYQAISLSAPGDIMNTAPIGDVEPFHMSFVWSAIAKLQRFQPHPALAWALSLCDCKQLRTDALRVLAYTKTMEGNTKTLLNDDRTNYVVMLRSGYEVDALAVAVGLNRSSMGHIQRDNGSLVLGLSKRWWIDDPGYQQYAESSEREFTVGYTAHNSPVINGVGQSFKKGKQILQCLPNSSLQVKFVILDLTDCYPPEARALRVWRAIWLVRDQHVVVCDFVQSDAPLRLGWYWHGHPSLFWGMSPGGMSLQSEESPSDQLHVMSPQMALGLRDLQRLPGSRGQQTVCPSVLAPENIAVWWVFSRKSQPPVFSINQDSFEIDGTRVSLGNCKCMAEHAVSFLPSEHEPVGVLAWRREHSVYAICRANPVHFSGEVEYAYYLMADGKRVLAQWYGPDDRVVLDIPVGCRHSSLKVHGFVREKANPDRRVMRVVSV